MAMESTPVATGEDFPEKLAVALSGGGYRAAAFSLGILDGLHRAGVLDRVKAVSTVSGGTFTGCAWALSLVDGSAFGEFFEKFYRKLQDTRLVTCWLDTLASGRTSSASQRRALITAAAETYATTLFADEHGRPRHFKEILESDKPLPTFMFNATEFRSGLAFRFQTSGRIGNANLEIAREAAGAARLGDIVAASSCFPGGFEPIAFPGDFAWPDGARPAVRGLPHATDVALMDGGINDNQGIESLMLSDERQEGPFGLLIIADVDVDQSEMFPVPAVGRRGFVTLGGMRLVTWLLLMACLGTMGVVGIDLWHVLRSGEFTTLDAFRLVVPTGLAAGTAWLLWTIRRLVKGALRDVPDLGARSWKYFRQLGVLQARDMATLRIRSLLAMSSRVFMSRVRRLSYRILWSHRDYESRRISAFLDVLIDDAAFDLPESVARPSSELKRVVEKAASVPTTLWFADDDPEQQACLVAAGRATACHSLMRYIHRRWPDPATRPPHAQETWKQALTEWDRGNADPLAGLALASDARPS